MVTSKDTDLKLDHVYRVVGRPLQLTRPAREEERFEGLRYVGTTVPLRRGVADIRDPMEMFYWFAERRWVLFKPGTFRADELVS